MAKFRKRPVVIEAVRWTGSNTDEILAFCITKASVRRLRGGMSPIVIETLEGDLTVSPGDWVIRGVKDEFYPCKDDIFRATYEAVDEAQKAPVALHDIPMRGNEPH